MRRCWWSLLSSSSLLFSAIISSSLDHQVLDSKCVADTSSFLGALILPIPSSHLVEHYIPGDHHLASLGIMSR